jgi:hypothetical protein
MSVIIAIGPASQLHGEAKMFNYSCGILKENYVVYVIDSTFSKYKILRPWYVVARLISIVFSNDISQIYLSYSRNKFMLFHLFVFIFFIKNFTNIKCIYHIHDTSLKKNLSGSFGKIVKILYSKCVDLTILPNKTLEKYSNIGNGNQIRFLLNPYIGTLISEYLAERHTFHFISFPSRFKNLDEVIKIANQADIALEVIGWNKCDYYRLYPKDIQSLARINFLGKCSHKNVMKKLNRSKGLISISDHEAMPLNVIEALLQSVPIYVKERSGYKYFIHNFDTVKILSTPEVLNKPINIGELQKSRDVALALFDKSKYDRDLVKIFSKL